MTQHLRVGIDIGGTFTDVFILDEDNGELRTAKTWSSPEDPSQLVEVFDDIAVDCSELSVFSHSATVGINAVVTRTGAATGLLATTGHIDVLDLGRGLRGIDQLWDLNSLRPHLVRPVIRRELRRPITERVLYDGSVLVPLDDDEVVRETSWLVDRGIQSLAIVYINSYLNPEHERRTKEIVEREFPGLPVFTSTDIFPVFREIFRTTSVAINAYISPKVDGYVGQLEQRLQDRGFDGLFTMMKVDGGFATADAVRGRGIETIHSGPVAGVTAARFLGDSIGRSNMLLIDMGGTTADVSIVTGGRPPVTSQYEIEQDLFLGIPAIEVQSIGAGGGSIAWLDAAGALRVGPQAAGSSPGPACYGRGGTKPTVSDAHLVRGTLSAEHFLGGRQRLDIEKARAAVATVAEPLGLPIEETAQGIIDIVEINMAGALRDISIFKGHNPKDYALVAFGAAGPMHGAALARAIGAAECIIPPWPGEFSALGLLASDYRVELGRSLVKGLEAVTGEEMTSVFEELEAAAVEHLTAQGVDPAAVAFTRWMDATYVGQSWDTAAELPAGSFDDAAVQATATLFEDAYERAWGNRLGMPIRVSSLRVTAVAAGRRPDLPRLADGGPDPVPEAGLGEVDSTLRSGLQLERRSIAIFDRARLLAGNVIDGPAIIAQDTSTTVLNEGDRARVDHVGNLVISVEDR